MTTIRDVQSINENLFAIFSRASYRFTSKDTTTHTTILHFENTTPNTDAQGLTTRMPLPHTPALKRTRAAPTTGRLTLNPAQPTIILWTKQIFQIFPATIEDLDALDIITELLGKSPTPPTELCNTLNNLRNTYGPTPDINKYHIEAHLTPPTHRLYAYASTGSITIKHRPTPTDIDDIITALSESHGICYLDGAKLNNGQSGMPHKEAAKAGRNTLNLATINLRPFKHPKTPCHSRNKYAIKKHNTRHLYLPPTTPVSKHKPSRNVTPAPITDYTLSPYAPYAAAPPTLHNHFVASHKKLKGARTKAIKLKWPKKTSRTQNPT